MVLGAATLGIADVTGVLPMGASTRAVELAGHHTSWIVPVIGLAFVAGAFAYATGIGAARRLGAKVATFVGLTEVLFATLFAWLLLGQRPTALQAVGGLVVIAGITLVRADEKSPTPAAEPVPAAV
jgi:drug/metabolite transporter (DMT)-like permease